MSEGTKCTLFLLVLIPGCMWWMMSSPPNRAGARENRRAQARGYSDSEIEQCVIKSDDFAIHRDTFKRAARWLVESGHVSARRFTDHGGWVRSVNHKPRSLYFVVGRSAHVKDRWYLDVTTGDLYRTHPDGTPQHTVPVVAEIR